MNTPEEVRPDVLARALEDRGFDSLWIGEHSHIPASRRTPYPAGGEMPSPYSRMMDPFVGLTLAATATTVLLLGTGVALPLEHDLFALAKSVATLDLISGGRVRFGVGVGWNEEEFTDHSAIPWRQRYRALEDCVAALRALWRDDDAEHHGEFFDFDAAWSFPKPIQRPYPPVVCGMAGRLGTEHAARWGDEWMPMDMALGDVAKRVAKFNARTAHLGRGRIPITLVTFGDPTFDTLKEYRDVGIERVIVGASRTGWDDPATTLPCVDHFATIIDELR